MTARCVTEIKIGIIGVGNCASSLVQGIHYYQDKRSDEAIDLMHWDVDGYSDHMSNYADPETFVLSDEPPLTKNQFNSTGENFNEERSN